MEWECTECGRTYHEPPDDCRICGAEELVPADAAERDRRFDPQAVYDRLFDPFSTETSLVEFNAAVNLAFALVVALSVLLLVVALVLLLL